MDGESLICRCGDAVNIDPDGRRTTCYDGRPHLDHGPYEDWAQRHGFTEGSLGWFPEVLAYPASIRVQLVSDRLLWACGLLPGIDFSQYPPWSGRGTTTGDAQPLSGFSGEHPWDLLPPEDPETPTGRAEVAESPREAPKEGDSTDQQVGGPSVVTRFGGDEGDTTPGKTAAKRWGE